MDRYNLGAMSQYALSHTYCRKIQKDPYLNKSNKFRPSMCEGIGTPAIPRIVGAMSILSAILVILESN